MPAVVATAHVASAEEEDSAISCNAPSDFRWQQVVYGSLPVLSQEQPVFVLERAA